MTIGTKTLFFPLHCVLYSIAISCCLGCHAWQGTPRPSIDELFSSAVNQSATNPENTVLAPDQYTITDTQPKEELPLPVADKKTGNLNEEFQDTDVREAIQVLAQSAGVSVVVDDKVRGVVNASIDKLSFTAAMDNILLPLGLVYAERDGQYFIGSTEPDSALFAYLAEQHQYRPAHRTTTEVVSSIPERWKRYVRVMEKSNTILIDAPRQHASLIKQRFQQVDQPIPQVILHAIVCVVSPDCGFKFGLNWNHAVAVNGQDAFSVGIENMGIRAKYSAQGAERVFSDFALTSAFVNLLAENGYLAIRASPRVMARDGEKANISISRETFFAAQATSTSGTDANANNFIFAQNIQKVDAGIMLDITPQIRGDIVTVQIEKAEVSEDIRTTSSDVSTNGYPVINRRSVSTTVHVQDGKTIVIGGLVQRQTVERINQVPGLSQLPLVGGLFQSIQRQERDAEVVIFISPRIVAPALAQERKPSAGPVLK